jgi:hypothetical protein
VLPSPPATAFSSEKGQLIFAQSLAEGNAKGFFKLIEQFRTQDEPAYCGLGTLTMVLNSLNVDPKRQWKGPWRWFHESMLDCCEPLELIQKQGLTFQKLVCLAKCNGAAVREFQARASSEDMFRQHLQKALSGEHERIVVSYSRKQFSQTGDGHFSPIGAYHAASDSALILDVARFKYPPHWVPVPMLWRAMMDYKDSVTKEERGYMLLCSAQQRHCYMSILWVPVDKTEADSSNSSSYLTVVDVLLHMLSDEQCATPEDAIRLLLRTHLCASSGISELRIGLCGGCCESQPFQEALEGRKSPVTCNDSTGRTSSCCSSTEGPKEEGLESRPRADTSCATVSPFAVVAGLAIVGRELPLGACCGAGDCESNPFEDAKEFGYAHSELAVAQVLAFPLHILKLASKSAGLVSLSKRLELEALPEEIRQEVQQLREMFMELVTEAVKCRGADAEDGARGSGLQPADLLGPPPPPEPPK